MDSMFMTPAEVGAEDWLLAVVHWVRLAVESVGIVVITIGVLIAVPMFVRALLKGAPEHYNTVRLTLARYLALALEFQLGADILATTVAPSWEQIGKLAAIAVIRTGLNYVLGREMRAERDEIRDRPRNATHSR